VAARRPRARLGHSLPSSRAPRAAARTAAGAQCASATAPSAGHLRGLSRLLSRSPPSAPAQRRPGHARALLMLMLPLMLLRTWRRHLSAARGAEQGAGEQKGKEQASASALLAGIMSLFGGGGSGGAPTLTAAQRKHRERFEQARPFAHTFLRRPRPSLPAGCVGYQRLRVAVARVARNNHRRSRRRQAERLADLLQSRSGGVVGATFSADDTDGPLLDARHRCPPQSEAGPPRHRRADEPAWASQGAGRCVGRARAAGALQPRRGAAAGGSRRARPSRPGGILRSISQR